MVRSGAEFDHRPADAGTFLFSFSFQTRFPFKCARSGRAGRRLTATFQGGQDGQECGRLLNCLS